MTPAVVGRVGDSYASVATILEAWVNRHKSEHTRRAYRGDVMAFVSFMGRRWAGRRREPAAVAGTSTVRQCLYSPHSLRATSAILLLDSGVPIEAVQICSTINTSPPPRFTTKRRRAVRDSAPHKMPI